VLRAALGRPALTGATALAIVSASTAAVAATTAHSADSLRADARNAAGNHAVNVAAFGPTFSVRLGRTNSRVYDAVQQDIRADRRADALRAARTAQRKALAAQRKALLSSNPKTVAKALMGRYGWGPSQFSCLDQLWNRESMWRIHAENPSSGAYGIPQALPGSKMSSAGSNWRTSALTQIRWGLGYIQDRYGSPCGAWGHSEGHGWY
jgi:hypothetical protein